MESSVSLGVVIYRRVSIFKEGEGEEEMSCVPFVRDFLSR